MYFIISFKVYPIALNICRSINHRLGMVINEGIESKSANRSKLWWRKWEGKKGQKTKYSSTTFDKKFYFLSEQKQDTVSFIP